MFKAITKEVELARGFIDKDGNAHKTIVLRPPTIDDEVTRDAEMASIKFGDELTQYEGFSETLKAMALIKQCTLSWDGIPKPELHHFRALSRKDGRLLIEKFNDLEEEDEKYQLGNETSQD
jgi:hypothetical protein